MSSTLKHHLKNVSLSFKNSASLLHDSLFVDNCLANFNSTEQYCETIVELLKKLLLSEKLDLRRGKVITQNWRLRKIQI